MSADSRIYIALFGGVGLEDGMRTKGVCVCVCACACVCVCTCARVCVVNSHLGNRF